MNAGPKCWGSEVGWHQTSAMAPEIHLPANGCIEQNYKDTHADHIVFFGGDFMSGKTITLPRNAKLSDLDRRFANELLLELNGLQNQLRPDIIDFTERKIYEIKSSIWVNQSPRNAASAIEQLASYYRTVETVRQKYLGPNWDEESPDWYPPHMLFPFKSDPLRMVCTSATEYKTGKQYLNTLNRPGLILYDVRDKDKSEEERKKRAQAMRIVALPQELAPMASLFEIQLRATLQEASDSEYLIVCSRDFLDSVLIPIGRQNIARICSLLEVPAMSIFQNPVIMMRMLGWSVIATAEVTYFVAVSGILASEALASVSAPKLIQVPKFITDGMKAANDVAALAKDAVPLAKAAGILFLVGVALPKNVQAATIKMERISAVRAIPMSSTWDLGTLATGVPIHWDGEQYYYLGRAVSSS